MNTQGAITMGSGGRSIRPKMPSGSYKTYQVATPLSTHYRRATCVEIECPAYLQGWTFKKADLIAAGLLDVVTHAGKRYREASLDDSSDVYLVFEPGQPCFQAAGHKISLERPEFFLAGRGHFAGGYSSRKANRFDTAEDWAESFAEHQDLIKRLAEGM